MLIDIDINEVFGVDVVEDGEGLAELVVGIGDPGDSGTTVLSFIAGWEADLGKIDVLVAGLERFREQATAAARRRSEKAAHPPDALHPFSAKSYTPHPPRVNAPPLGHRRRIPVETTTS